MNNVRAVILLRKLALKVVGGGDDEIAENPTELGIAMLSKGIDIYRFGWYMSQDETKEAHSKASDFFKDLADDIVKDDVKP